MVKSKIKDGDRVMVVLDSDHSRDHVLAECRAYGPLVSKGCYLVVADTLIGFCDETQTPRKRSKIWTKGNEPLAALNDFMLESDKFIVDPELNGKLVLSSSPKGYLLAAKS
jgi:cephalosporin hydroxylase